MTKTVPTSPSHPRRNLVGRHRARTFLDTLFRVHERACRRGQHRYLKPQPIGGGIQRSSCSVCGSVSIDLRDLPEPSRPPRLFRRNSVRERG